MKYTLTIGINAPKEFVMKSLLDQSTLDMWQPELIDCQLAYGEPGTRGASTDLSYQFGKRKVTMREEIKDIRKDEIELYYEAPGAKNWVTYRFNEVDKGQTIWELCSNFKCSGLLKVIAFLNPGMFKSSSQKSMQRFKTFIENSNN